MFVIQVFTAKQYALVQGLPGTGKTSTIEFVVRLLVAHGKRVLVSSYTHAAVDNVLLKLVESGMSASVARVGQVSQCHPGVHPCLVERIAAEREKANVSLPTAESLHQIMTAARVVGVSALSAPRSALLVGQHFDVVIVDEAGQISQPAIIGALMAADSFVLVGDHMQLPPLVTSQIAEEGGKSTKICCTSCQT